jgi:hypothetical protein
MIQTTFKKKKIEKQLHDINGQYSMLQFVLNKINNNFNF